MFWYPSGIFEWINSPPEIDLQHLLVKEGGEVTKVALRPWWPQFANGGIWSEPSMNFDIHKSYALLVNRIELMVRTSYLFHL